MSHEESSVQRNNPPGKFSLEMIMIVLAAVGAVVIGKYPEAGAVILLYLCGKLVEKQAVKKSREKIASSAVMTVKNGWTYEDAVSQKTRTERLISRFSRIFTPAVLAGAIVVAVVPSVVTGNWTYWIRTACTFLVVGCIGTLVASVSLAFSCGIAVSTRRGVLFKSGQPMETINNMRLFVTGKTGILTDAQYGLQRVVSAIAFEPGNGKEEKGQETEEEFVLRLCAGAMKNTKDPVFACVERAAEVWKVTPDTPEEVQEEAGQGVCARLPEGRVCAGTREYLMRKGIAVAPPLQAYGLQICVALGHDHIGTLLLADRVNKGAESLMNAARHVGAKTAVLTEESEINANAIAKQLSIDLSYGSLTPAGKQSVIKDMRRKVGTMFYIGSGLRDAAVMESADVSGTLSSGTEEAVRAADILYMSRELKPAEDSIDLAFVTTRIASENILLSLLIKAGMIFLGFVGHANLWLAIIADTAVAVICILNAVRLLYFGKYRLR